MNRSKQIALATVVAMSAMITAALVQFGSSQKPAPTEMTALVTIIGSLDTSASDREVLPGAVMGMADVLTSLPEGAFVTLYRTDSSCKEVFNDAAPAFSEEFVQQLTPRLKTMSTTDNTYLHLLTGQITNRLKTVKGKAVIIIDTDYFGEGMNAANRNDLANHATAWGLDRRVVGVIVSNVNPARMAAVRADFAGARGKLTVTPDGVTSDVVNVLLGTEVAR